MVPAAVYGAGPSARDNRIETRSISLPGGGASLVIGLDVEGTMIPPGLLDREGAVLAEREVATPDTSPESFLRTLDAGIEELFDSGVAAIGYGAAADLERGSGRILRALNLPLEDVDLAARSRERFELPVGIGSDAGAGTLARREAVRPANARLRIVAAAVGSEAGPMGAGIVAFQALDGLR